MKLPTDHLSLSFLRSFGQVMLQANAATGFLFLLGIALNSVVMLLGSVLAVFSGLALAKLCKYDADYLQQGLYGFNAALVGIAVWFVLPISLNSLLLVVIGGVLSTFFMQLMLKKLPAIPAFTSPFILTTWLLLAFIEYSGMATLDKTVISAGTTTLLDYAQASLYGIAAVMLQESWLTGLVFLAALFCQSAKVAAWAIVGSCIAMLIAISFNLSQEMVMSGLYSFNACLVAIALSTTYPKSPGYILCAICFSVLLTWVFKQVELPALTAPFVLSTWFILAAIKLTKAEAKLAGSQSNSG